MKALLASPWPFVLGLMVPIWLLLQRQVYAGLTLGVLDRGVLELWVHGRQPGWLDWVPFIHPPGYSLFMNSVHALVGGDPARAARFVLVYGGAFALATALLAAWAAWRRIGVGAAILVAALVLFSPQALRPFEHYPLARLLLLSAYLACTGPSASLRGRVAACLLAVEVHLASWFLLGPLLALEALFGDERARDRRVLGWVLGLFLVTTAFGLLDVLEFGGGEKSGVGSPTLEWANPLLFAALLPVALRGTRWKQALSLLAFIATMLALQALQVADGAPFPFSLHYFELIEAPAALVVVAAAWSGPGWLRWGIALLLLGSQGVLFARGLAALFVQPQWLFMASSAL